MPIQIPSVSTNIETPLPSYNPNEAALRALLTGAQMGSEAANIRAKAALEQQSKEGDLRRTIAANLGKFGKLPPGMDISSGTARLAVNPEVRAQIQAQTQDASARRVANAQYTKETAKTGEQVKFAKEMLDTLTSNAPNARGKVVQAYMGMYGFKRFNTPESYALADPSLKEQTARLLQKVGLTPEDMFAGGALNESQRSMFARDAHDTLDSIKNDVKTAQARAVNAYSLSPYASASGFEKFQKLGAEFDPQIEKVQTGLSKHIKTPAMPRSSQVGPQADQGILGRLTGMVRNPLAALGIGAGSSQQPTPSPAPTGPATLLTPEQWMAAKKARQTQTGGIPNAQ